MIFDIFFCLVSLALQCKLKVLGADGFGRSDTREALRRFFEVDKEHVSRRSVSHLFFRTVSRCFHLPFFLYRINSCFLQSKVVRPRMKSEASKGRGCRPLWPCQARQNFCGCGQSSVPRQQSVCWRPILQFFCQWTFIPIPPECKAPLHRSLS